MIVLGGKTTCLGKIQLGWKIPWEKTIGLEKYVGKCDWDGKYLGKNIWAVDFRIDFPEFFCLERYDSDQLDAKMCGKFRGFQHNDPWMI